MEFTSKSVDEIDEDREIQNLKKLEAALFISGRFLSMQELVSLTDINPIILRKLISDLSDKYSNSAIEIVEREGKWKMDVVPEFSGMINKLAGGTSELTKAEQETLAVIAYKQPIKQSVLIKIRGNKAYDHVKNFVEMGFITKKKMGHTSELSLSSDFYDYFQIEKGNGIEGLR